MANITELFIEYLIEKASQITDVLIDKAEACKQDYLAVTGAGARKNQERWRSILNIASSGSAEIIGYSERVDGKTAALINGFNAHALELDDGQRFAMIHLGASIISAIKAASDEQVVKEEDFLRGIIMGYEAACRLAISMQPSHKNKGYHTAGTCGTIGSAIGVAFALNLNKVQMKRVITCAAGSSAGMLEIQEQSSEVKPYNLGRAAMDGLMAAYMGLTDFEMPDDMLGGERGFYRIFSDNCNVDKLTEHTKYFEIERIYVKPYVSCRHSHSAVEAAIKLHEELDISSIEKVEVRTYKLGVKGHDHADIQCIAAAKLSTPYAVAAGLLYGRADLTVFEPLDEGICRLAKRVSVIEDEDLTKECPNKRIAIVEVKLRNGETKTCRVDYAKGEPENPMTKEELEQKNQMLVTYMANCN